MEVETNSVSGASRANYENILRGVVAYVDVWSGNDNRCECVKAELKILGAVVQNKFLTNVTHVLFNEGSLATYKKAKTKKIPLVSVMWIEESKRILKKACEKAFCALHLDRYEERDLFSATNSFKRQRRGGSYRRISKKKKASPSDEENCSLETYFNPELFNENAALLKDGIISTLEHVTGEMFSVAAEEDAFPCSQFTAEINEPLTKKLYNRFFSELKKVEDVNEDKSKILTNSKSEVSGQINSSNPLIVSGKSEQMKTVEVKNDSLNWWCDKKGAQVPITFFFQSAKITTRLPAIVMTGMPFDEVELLTSIVKKIGGFEVERRVKAACKHVVCGYPPKRTLNVLHGIARGCWILSKEWVLKSLDCNQWLDEEEFELNYYLPAIKKVRVARQIGGPVYRHFLFTGCGPIYIMPSCSPPASELKELLVLCGAYVVCNLRSSKVVVVSQGKLIPISARRSQDKFKFVNEKWVLDSISEDSLRPFSFPYIVQHTAAAAEGLQAIMP